MASVNTRIFFSKTDRAKYISHLDLYGVVMRTIKRAKLPVWYTEGYNPRMYVQFMLPLSLGQEGLREAADFRLLEDIPHEEVTNRLNDALPADIRVVETSVPVKKNIDNLRVYFKTTNPFMIWSATPDVDPDVTINGYRTVDVPVTKSFLFGLNFTF